MGQTSFPRSLVLHHPGLAAGEDKITTEVTSNGLANRKEPPSYFLSLWARIRISCRLFERGVPHSREYTPGVPLSLLADRLLMVPIGSPGDCRGDAV